ncbi:ABC transporter substrate-binding protein [Inquilinus limosus]|uniref:ABC transporter substrate-binding protein n=1 Tax=Inquilinus limosus TaxID=171674 RepID=UPI003F163980
MTIRTTAAALAAGVLAVGLAGAAGAQEILFWSTQATPVEESQAMREAVLAGFGKPVTYSAQEPGPFMTRIQAELKAGSGAITVIGGLHGEFANIPDGLVDLSGIVPEGAINARYLDLGKLGTGEQKYLPWMQATYVMAANKQALQYLPQGADINALTYEQLAAWGKAMAEATRSPKIGFPAGPKGLMHRFFQGYLYPSYTGSPVVKFKSPEAEKMWTAFRDLWSYVTPASTGYAFMQEPLLTGEVWVAWDHVARLKDALNQKPDDFVVFPVPAGPAGRAHMPVLTGIGIPKTTNALEDAKALVAYMEKPESQIAMMKATGFFPVVEVQLPADVPNSIKMLQPVVAAQSAAKDSLPVLLPMGLGDAGGRYNKAFSDTFQRIVLSGQDIREVLDQQAQALQAIFDDKGAPCWAPDPVSDGPCKVQ